MQDISGASKFSLENLASIIVRGGWPASIGIDGDIKYRFAKEYVKSLIHEDVRKIDGIERNLEKMQNILRSLARNITTQVSNSTIEGDIKNSFADDISRPTLIDYLNTFGFMFESLCIRDLKIYMQSYGGNITFYRDEKDFKIDAIIRTNNGMWGAIEIKLGAGYIDSAANNLLKFKDKVDVEKCGEPAFLAVLTGTDYSYKRDDGVYVVSIGTLKN